MTGIELTGLTKSYGTVRAVRGIDVSVAAGETVALLGPNGAGKSTTIDMLLGLLPPDGGTVSVFGKTPSAAVHAGSIGAMLQTGALIRDLTVRELVTMMASLYPSPLAVDEVLELTGLTELADRRTAEALRRPDPARPLRGRARQQPGAARARRADGGDGRRGAPCVLDRRCASSPHGGKTVLFATHYLEEADAYADRVVLMAHGRIVADGPPTEIKAMVGTRTIRATLPDVDLRALARARRRLRRRAARRAVILNCSDSDAGDPRAARRAFPRRATSRSAAPGSRRRSCS